MRDFWARSGPTPGIRTGPGLRALLLVASALAGSASLAQDRLSEAALGGGPASDPLSTIDWLSDSLADPSSLRPEGRAPPLAGDGSALAPEVTVTPLDAPESGAIGLVPAAASGLPSGLWGQSAVDTLVERLAALPDRPLPAARDALKRVILARLDPPRGGGAPGALTVARIDTLLRWGALDEAAALLAQAGTARPDLFRRAFDIALLQEREQSACTQLEAAPGIAPSIPAHIFCLARSGDWAAAALTLDTAEALGEIDAAEEALLARFLDLDESDAALPARPGSGPLSPLEWRMLEAVGERRSTVALPVAFAHAELRPTSGWKARVEATERLVRVGALPPSRLAAVYAERAPAASGGVWERVAAVQALEAALQRGQPRAVARQLEPAWEALSAVGLGPAFAALYAPRLTPLDLAGPEATLAHRIALLGPDYEAVALAPPPDADPVARALARGEAPPPDGAALGPLGRTLGAAFALPLPEAPASLARLQSTDRLGEALLAALDTLADGARADPADLTGALVFLRGAGLEDTARRAALQIYLAESGA